MYYMFRGLEPGRSQENNVPKELVEMNWSLWMIWELDWNPSASELSLNECQPKNYEQIYINNVKTMRYLLHFPTSYKINLPKGRAKKVVIHGSWTHSWFGGIGRAPDPWSCHIVNVSLKPKLIELQLHWWLSQIKSKHRDLWAHPLNKDMSLHLLKQEICSGPSISAKEYYQH